jgi:hypothetical protein
MSSDPASARRSLVAQGVIALGACLGLHFFVAEPFERRLDERRAEIARLIASSQEAAQLVTRMPDVMRTLDRNAAEAARMEARGAPVRDEGAMFTRIMTLAAGADVSVEVMDPVAVPAKGGPGLAAPRPQDRALAYSIRATGAYADVCRFLHALQNNLAYTVVNALRLAPSPGDSADQVTAIIETAHFAVDLTPLPPPEAIADAGAETAP